MTVDEIKEVVEREKIIAIVRGIAAEKCMKVADALYEGGIRLMEITFNQKDPSSFQTTADCIAAIGKAYEGRMLVGAGTVITVDTGSVCNVVSQTSSPRIPTWMSSTARWSWAWCPCPGP